MLHKLSPRDLLRALPLLAIAMVGCRGGDAIPANEASPPAGVATLDSLPTPIDGVAPAVVDSASVPGDTTTQVAADSVPAEPVAQDVLPVIDSLRSEIAALRQEIAAGAAPASSQLQPRDTAAVGDGGLAQATGDRVRETAEGLRFVGLRTFWATILISIAWLLVRLSVWLLEVFAERTPARRLFLKKLIPIARLVIWSGIAYYIVTGVFQVDRSGMLAATAALGVGIGFAAQGVLKNFIGGLIVVFDQPFQVGDKVSVGGTYGEVVGIGMRSTRIVTPDDNLVTVPNAQVVEEQVSNANAGALECQVVVNLYLPGWVDVRKAKAIAHAAAANSKYVSLDKPIVVMVADEFKETFLTHFKVKSYVLDTRLEAALASDVTERAKAGFLEAGLLWPMVASRSSFAREHDGPGGNPA